MSLGAMNLFNPWALFTSTSIQSDLSLFQIKNNNCSTFYNKHGLLLTDTFKIIYDRKQDITTPVTEHDFGQVHVLHKVLLFSIPHRCGCISGTADLKNMVVLVEYKQNKTM